MDSTRILQPQEDCTKPRTRTGLAFLDEELLSAERGEEPNLDRVLRALDIICDDAQGHDVDGIEPLCDGLRGFIRELREDSLELSIEDLDVFLLTSGRIRALASELDIGRKEHDACSDSKRAPIVDLISFEFAPEFLTSGLTVEAGEEEITIRFPQLIESVQTARVIADLEDLWERTPANLPWLLNLTTLERIPVTILATLTKLRITSGAGARLLRLDAKLSGIQSEELSESLARYFQLG